jgi:hypothetical protein
MVDDETDMRGASKALALISRGASLCLPPNAISPRRPRHATQMIAGFVPCRLVRGEGGQALPAVGVAAFMPPCILDGGAEVLRRDLVRSHLSRRQPVPSARR